MSDFAARIEGAGLRLSEQHREISTLAASMAERATADRGLPVETRDALSGFNDAAHQFADSVADLESSSLHEIEHSTQELGSLAHNCADHVETRWQALVDELVDLRERVGSLPQVLETHLSGFRHGLEAHGSRLAAANSDALQAIGAVVSSLDDLIRQQLDTARDSLSAQLERFEGDLDAELGPKLQRIAGDATRTASDSLDAFARAGSEASRILQQTLEHALSTVEEELHRAIQEKFPQLQKELVDDAAEALAKEVIDGIATSTIGAEVSSAMSPYLVELIALKKVLEALLEAIRVFKNITTVGGLFG